MALHRLLILAVVLALGIISPAWAATTPTTDFTDNGDGTVTHKTTKLVWKRCSEGQSWSGSTCTGTAKTYTWAQATALTATFAGQSDWRLPTIAELLTIVERESSSPAINSTIFPGTMSYFFWSASSYAGRDYYGWQAYDYAWRVNFDDGRGTPNGKVGDKYVRLVRGGQLIDSLGLYTPSSDFSDNGDGSVTHKKTNLTWKRCAEGQSWAGSTCSGTAKTYTWSAANALSTSDWRLPSLNELLTIVEWSKSNPAINPTIFPNPASVVWSASSYAGSSDFAWYVYFGPGDDAWDSKTNAFEVRLVRGGQSIGASSTPADCFFNWAEKNYSQYFSPGGNSQTQGEYYYRQYAGNIYLATSSKDNHLYYSIGGSMGDAGTVAQWYTQAGCQ